MNPLHRFKTVGFYLSLGLVVMFSISPIAWQILTSLRPDEQMTALPPLLSWPPVLDHYRAVFHDHPFARIIVNSLAVAGLTTLMSLAIGSVGAFSLTFLGFKRRGLILGMALAVSMLPPISTVGPLYLMIRALGLRDTWWALVAAHTTFALPLALWILTSFFQKIPGELYKAAQIDGCSPLEAFSKVLLPLSVPGLAAAGVLVFVFSWNEFLYALTFTTTEASRTIPVGIALFPGLHEIPYGDMAAASVTVTLPVILMAFLFQRRIADGLTAGAVKG